MTCYKWDEWMDCMGGSPGEMSFRAPNGANNDVMVMCFFKQYMIDDII